ncbi:thiamine pyrophosphate-binding protein [Chloroflexota bacterium]
MEMTGAEIICRILKNEGVRYLFGVPGYTEVPLLHTLARISGIRYISAAHESVSVGMADGYARASGQVGIVLVHTTPGAANIIGNLYNAYNAGTPLMVIAGLQDSRLQWGDPSLDSDLLPMVTQYTKSRWRVSRAEDIARALHRALKEAITPPTGPVFLSVPRDLQSQSVSLDESSLRRIIVPVEVVPGRELLKEAAQLLADASKPAIFAGHAVPDAGAIPELVNLAEELASPVYTSSQVSKLIFPTNHPLYYGKVGMTSASMLQMSGSADVLLVLGSNVFKQIDYADTPLIAPTTKVIQVDLDPQGLGKYCPTEVAIVASPKHALGELATEISQLMSTDQRRKCHQRLKQLENARREAKVTQDREFKKDWEVLPIRPWRAIKDIAAVLPSSTVVVDEAVMLTSYVSNIMEFTEPGSYFNCNAYLGWGLPASLGVALGTTRRPVVAIIGDGSALFGLQAMWTATKYQIPVIMLVLNNHGYAAIRWSLMMYGKMMSEEVNTTDYDLGEVNISKLAAAFDIDTWQIERPAEIRPALEKAIALNKPALLEIMVDPKDLGYARSRLS